MNPSASNHGGKRVRSGRPLLSPNSFKKSEAKRKLYKEKWCSNHRRISLEITVHESWKNMKRLCKYKSDTAFAKHLLSLELRRQSKSSIKNTRTKCKGKQRPTKSKPSVLPSMTEKIDFMDVNMESEQSDVEPIFYSTPIKSKHQDLFVSYSNKSEGDEILNITGTSSLQSSDNLSKSYSILDGTVSVYRSSSSGSSSGDEGSDSDMDSSSMASSDEDSDNDGDSSDGNITFFEIEEENEQDKTSEPTAEIVQQSLLPGMVDSYFVPEQPKPSPPKTFLAPNVKPRSHELNREEHNVKHQDQMKLAKSTKIICTLDLLLDIFQEKCRHPTCNDKVYTKHTLIGTCVMIEWKCHSGHAGKFYSSYDCNKLAATNLQTAASILLSGNNFYKMEKFARFLGLSFISSSTFFRFQRLYCLPVINEWWEWQKGLLQNKLKGKKIVVSGDGQCDSPGYSAKNLCYFLMEMETDFIIDLHVADKRQTDLKSTNMEREALKIILNRLENVLDIGEVVTDASSSIIKLLEDKFENIFHSLDVWHKSKNIRKSIIKIAKSKENRKIMDWCDEIITHFWYCCEVASKNGMTQDEALKEMKDKWFGLLYHVCNTHTWLGGKCGHGELPEERNLECFDRREEVFKTLQKIITNQKLLDTFRFYTRFRHTGSIECANNLSLAYCPKRCSFKFPVFTARKQLAAIDWNYHKDLPANESDTHPGEVMVSRKYNQRTKSWDSKIIKKAKDYTYITLMVAKILDCRMVDNKSVKRRLPLSDDDPRKISATIATVTPEDSRTLHKRKVSRFQN